MIRIKAYKDVQWPDSLGTALLKNEGWSRMTIEDYIERVTESHIRLIETLHEKGILTDPEVINIINPSYRNGELVKD